MTGAGTFFASAAFVILVGWRLHRRMRRLIGRQRSRTWRHVVGVSVLPLVLLMLGAGAWFAAGLLRWRLRGP